MKEYYLMRQSARQANIYIFGDIVDEEYFETDVSAASLATRLDGLDVDEIDVHINSYGGSVSSGLAIYNSLKNHKAKVKTYCDGFACSIASVIFMAGDERIMNEASLLMIHNAWMYTAGNAEQLRKDADDLDTITQASMAAYMSRAKVTEDELKELLDAETWLLPSAALEKGFATSIVAEAQTNKVAASARRAIFSIITGAHEPQGVTADEIAEKLFARIKAEAPTPAEPPAEPAPTEEPPAPQENKVLKMFNALLGGK